MTRAAGKKKVRRRKRTGLCDLPAHLVRQAILERVPITSLSAVRSTCKLWDSLTKEWILGKAAAAMQQFSGFMIRDSKVCSVGFHLCRSKDKEDEDLLDLSVKQVDLFNQIKISRVFHCDGLLLCAAKDTSCLVAWNPYLGQTKWIGPRRGFHKRDSYALGYDINRNHKILRILYYNKGDNKRYEIYEFSSNSWRVVKVPLECQIKSNQSGVSLKGNTYFYAYYYANDESKTVEDGTTMEESGHFLLCFDFTTERFGRRLSLPFRSKWDETAALSCVREEKLAVLHQHDPNEYSGDIVQIWVTTTIEPNYVSWSKFLRVKMEPFELTGIWFNGHTGGGSFFVNEEAKVAVVFDIDGYQPNWDPETKKVRETICYHTAFVIGEDGYFKSVSLGPCPAFNQSIYWPSQVCSSSYHPSLVQLHQPHREEKERGV